MKYCSWYSHSKMVFLKNDQNEKAISSRQNIMEIQPVPLKVCLAIVMGSNLKHIHFRGLNLNSFLRYNHLKTAFHMTLPKQVQKPAKS